MLLNKIHLDPRCREARRDISDPYQLHSTLCRAFNHTENKGKGGEFLWRLEPETEAEGHPILLVQSRVSPNWSGIGVQGWLAKAYPPIDLQCRLNLDSLKIEQRYRFRLRANPSVTKNGKRLGLLRLAEQEKWLESQGEKHGFALQKLPSFDLQESIEARIDVRVSQGQMLRGRQHSGNGIRIFSVLYDGIITVTETEKFSNALRNGVGHGKVLGLGLLSVVPIK